MDQINKQNNADSSIQRMKALMTYGLNEGKKEVASSIEYSKIAADGKLYGVIREGTKYYIKVAADRSKGLVTENFDYIGGFRNRKDYQYDSFAMAQRQIDEKLKSINESVGDVRKKVIAESWDVDKAGERTVKDTHKMQEEIARERQIMENASRIDKGNSSAPFTQAAGKEYNASNNLKGGKPATNGKAADANKGYKTVKGSDICPNCGNSIKNCTCGKKKGKANESTEYPLTSRKNPEYMDKTHGTEIGDSAPFDDSLNTNGDDLENGVVAESEKGIALHKSQNQNVPNPGVNDVGDGNPFKEKVKGVNEAIEDMDDDADVSDDINNGADVDIDSDDADTDVDDDTDADDDDKSFDLEIDDDADEDADLDARMDTLEDKLDQLLDAVRDDEYDDDEPLYPDDDEDEDEDEPIEDDEDSDVDKPEDECGVFETRAFRQAMIREGRNRRMRRMNEENRLNDFGKHPAYQKKVMSLPPKDQAEFPNYYDMNDESTHSEAPYGQQIGSGAPFEVDVDELENSIAESLNRFFRKNQ
jgi:hypothetical protein